MLIQTDFWAYGSPNIFGQNVAIWLMACPSRIWPYVIVPDGYPNIVSHYSVVDMVAGYYSFVYLICHEFKPLYEFFSPALLYLLCASYMN